MHRDRRDLEKILSAVINKLNDNKEFSSKVINNLLNKIEFKKINSIFNLSVIDCFNISTEELCLITFEVRKSILSLSDLNYRVDKKYLLEFVKQSELNLWFEDKEIAASKKLFISYD
ncbi:hypothetical protein [Inconstantimicrobium mannanitabidum]|uniref:Uncharacterized protein n=1 Tax=Inconstantimicrobium mannanitabidum TaxID=1604901 RepID=A0ACB5R8M9_9CLOT|nr:hypothetical protein [Clostridium sp. TW13]GKX65553.1 hypothetical protein rsdtw13_08110 [Clostridium sp. TW13]